MTTTAEWLLNIFAEEGRKDVYAAGQGVGFCPVEGEITQDIVQQHLDGVTPCGIYLASKYEKVSICCTDHDNHEDTPEAREGVRQSVKAVNDYMVNELGLDPVVEISASGKGCHQWLFFSQPEPLMDVYNLLSKIRHHSGADAKYCEIYPKQPQLTGKRLGNLVRLPLWGKSWFVKQQEGKWGRIDPDFVPDYIASGVCQSLLEQIPDIPYSATSLAPTVESVIRSDNLLKARRLGNRAGLVTDERMSTLAFDVPVRLILHYIPTDTIVDTIQAWGAASDYEKAQNEDWVIRMLPRAYDFASGRNVINNVQQHNTAYELLDNSWETDDHYTVSTGLTHLDAEMTGGLPLGALTSIIGLSSHTKTALALHLLQQAASDNIPSGFISLEMPAQQLRKRLKQRYTGRSREEATAQLAQDAPLYLYYDQTHIDDIEKLIDTQTKERSIRFWAIDYLELVEANHEQENWRIAESLQRLEKCAQRNQVVICMICQAREEVGRNRELADLHSGYGSSVIRKASDCVLTVTYPFMFDKEKYANNFVVLNHCKNKMCGTQKGIVKVGFDPATQQYSNFQEQF